MVEAEAAGLASHLQRVSASDDGEVIRPLEGILEDKHGASGPKAGELIRAQAIARVRECRRGETGDRAELQSVLSGEGAGLGDLLSNLAAVRPVEAKPEFVHHRRAEDVTITE